MAKNDNLWYLLLIIYKDREIEKYVNNTIRAWWMKRKSAWVLYDNKTPIN